MSEPNEAPQKIRIEGIECWSCGHEFGFMTTLEKDHVVSVYCGICNAENVLDLEPFRTQTETFLKSGTGGSQQSAGGYQLPKRIQGRKP